MAALSVEYHVVRDSFDRLVDAVKPVVNEVAVKAFTKVLISTDIKNCVENSRESEYNRASRLLDQILNKIKENAAHFDTFIAILQDIPVLKGVADELDEVAVSSRQAGRNIVRYCEDMTLAESSNEDSQTDVPEHETAQQLPEDSTVVSFQCCCGKNCSLDTYVGGECRGQLEKSFPFLNLNHLNECNKEKIIRKLLHETMEMIQKFRKFRYSVFKSLKVERKSVDEVVEVALCFGLEGPPKPICDRHSDELSKVTTISGIHSFLIKHAYVSFINYGILKEIVECLGTPLDKKLLEEYLGEFGEYCKRQVFEVPKSVLASPPLTIDPLLVVKVDEQIWFKAKRESDKCIFTANDMYAVEHTIARVINLDHGHILILDVAKGCVQLSFAILSFQTAKLFPITTAQLGELLRFGITILNQPNVSQSNRHTAFSSIRSHIIDIPITGSQFVDIHSQGIQIPSVQPTDVLTADVYRNTHNSDIQTDVQSMDVHTSVHTPDDYISIQTPNFHTSLQNAAVQTADIKSPDVQTADVKIPDVQTVDIKTLDVQYRYPKVTTDVKVPTDIKIADLKNTVIKTADIKSADVQTPDVQTADVQTADVQTVDVKIPDVQTPDVQTADVQTVDVEIPDVQTADVQTVDVKTPDVQSTDDIKIPDVQTTDVKTPDVQTTDVQTSDVQSTVNNSDERSITFDGQNYFLQDLKGKLDELSLRSSQVTTVKKGIIPAFKVFVVGNQSAGKSTLVKALLNRLTDTSLLGSVIGYFQKVSGVELQTVGIIPTHVHSPQLGHIILYDFAGQYEYYSSHATYLEKLASSPGVLFLLVVDISKDAEEIVRTLQFWSTFIANLCNCCVSMPEIMVVGSHADVARKRGQSPFKKLSSTYNKLDSSLASPKIESRVVLNCTKAASSGLSSVSRIIATRSQSVQKECDVDVQVHLLNGVIKQQYGFAAKFSDISAFLLSEKNILFRRRNLLPSDNITLSKHLTTLSEHGQLLYLRNNENILDSWVILNEEMLLSQVNGTIFAPEHFKQHHNISSSTGVVPLSEIKKIFPNHNPQMIVGFLTSLEFCHQIGESEASLISRGHLQSSDTQSESYYFFPALVSEERPEESCKSIVQAGHKTGWCLQRIQEEQFFTSRFLHVLLLQLSFRFALVPDSPKEETPCPVVQRECNVWKSGLTDGGIHWLTMDGVEAIVEVVEQCTAVTVVVGCQEGGEMASVELRSDLIKTVLNVKEKYSGAVEVQESLISPSELESYPLKSPKIFSTFSIEKIATAVSAEKKFATRKQGPKQESIPINDLLYFEPFSSLSTDILKELFEESNDKKELDVRFLKNFGEAMQDYVNNLQQILHVKAKALKGAVHSSPSSVRDDPAHHCYLVLKIWKEQGHRSYGDLRSTLSKFSVFCGRNPLVLAGVSEPVKNGVLQSPDLKETSRTFKPDGHTETTLPPIECHDVFRIEQQSENDSDEHTDSLPRKSDRPTLKDLQLLNCRGGRRLRVLDTVAADWKYLATSLGFEGPVIRSIEVGALLQPEEACHRVFTKWLDGGDGLCEPVTWGTLIQCLIDAGLVDIAEELEEILR